MRTNREKQFPSNRWAVALFNRGEQTAAMEFDPAELKLTKSSGSHDLWRQRDLPAGVVRFNVGPHDAEIVSLPAPNP